MGPCIGLRLCSRCSGYDSGYAKTSSGLHSHNSELLTHRSGQAGGILRSGNGNGLWRGQDSPLSIVVSEGRSVLCMPGLPLVNLDPLEVIDLEGFSMHDTMNIAFTNNCVLVVSNLS
jgi:hypothetical protein